MNNEKNKKFLSISFFPNSRKGSDKIISVYWFVILFVVAAAIVYMVASFYGRPYDVRESEANALMNRVADCFSEGGYLKEGVKDLLTDCSISFDVEDSYGWKSKSEFYVEVELLDFNSKNKLSDFTSGNAELKDFCEIKDGNSPVCVQRSFYSIDEKNAQYQVNILSIVRKTEKNV